MLDEKAKQEAMRPALNYLQTKTTYRNTSKIPYDPVIMFKLPSGKEFPGNKETIREFAKEVVLAEHKRAGSRCSTNIRGALQSALTAYVRMFTKKEAGIFGVEVEAIRVNLGKIDYVVSILFHG